ncbi:hypothetical protein [Scytonema sp. PRP1]|uniref:hypothetical protein n=1 Tax=Scytonema sp. PRP1 TaxID=3120513 RepID=UPI00300D3DFA
MQDRQEQISQVVVTAQQMRDIEERIFTVGMPVAALMEKVAGLIARRIYDIYPLFGEHQHKGKASSFPHQSPQRGEPPHSETALQEGLLRRRLRSS